MLKVEEVAFQFKQFTEYEKEAERLNNRR